QSIRTGHQCGADCHQPGGASTLATQVALDWVMYCSIPKNANGMVSRPSTVPAIQPEVFSRSFCSIGRSGRDEAAQSTRNEGRVKTTAKTRARIAAGPGLDRGTNGGVDGTRTRDLRRDRPAF